MAKTNLEMLKELTEHLDRKDAELKRSENRLRTVIELAPFGMFLVTSRTIRWVNKRLCNITGYEPEEMKNQSTRMLYESQEEFDRVGRAVYCGLPEAKTETRIRRKDGVLIYCILHVVVIDSCDNDAVVATYIDTAIGAC